MDREYLKELTRNSLAKELYKIEKYYMKIYDKYYSNNQCRDDVFLKDLVDAIQGISAVLEVYVEHGFNIRPNYALEKLKWAKSYLDSNIRYFENKIESDGKDE